MSKIEGFDSVFVPVYIRSSQEVMLAGPIYTRHQLSPPLPPSLSLSPSLPSLPLSLPSFVLGTESQCEASCSCPFPVLCSFSAIQNEFPYSKYTVHETWKSLVWPALCSRYKLSRLYLAFDRPPCYYNYHQHQKGYRGKLYQLPPTHFPLCCFIVSKKSF